MSGWGAVEILNVIRVVYAVLAGVLIVILLWRAARYRDRTRETAYLHLMGVFLLAAAALTAVNNIGKRFTLVMPLNVLGIIGGYLFIIKTPMERVITWKERRGDDPDWDHIIGGPDR